MAAVDENLEVTTPEGATTEAVEVPSWVPEKFRSNPEEFGKSYSTLERQFHAQAAELKQQRETMEQFILESQQPATPETNADQIYQAYENDPVQTMAWLARQAAEQAVAGLQPQLQQREAPIKQAQNELLAYTIDQMVAQRVPDWGDQKQGVIDYIADRPWLLPEAAVASPQTAADALHSAYKAYRYDELNNQSQTQAEQLKAANDLAKRQAQTLSGSPGRPEQSDEDKDYWESVKNVKTNRYGG